VVTFTAPENVEMVSFGFHPALKVTKITDDAGKLLTGERSADGLAAAVQRLEGALEDFDGIVGDVAGKAADRVVQRGREVEQQLTGATERLDQAAVNLTTSARRGFEALQSSTETMTVASGKAAAQSEVLTHALRTFTGELSRFSEQASAQTEQLATTLTRQAQTLKNTAIEALQRFKEVNDGMSGQADHVAQTTRQASPVTVLRLRERAGARKHMLARPASSTTAWYPVFCSSTAGGAPDRVLAMRAGPIVVKTSIATDSAGRSRRIARENTVTRSDRAPASPLTMFRIQAWTWPRSSSHEKSSCVAFCSLRRCRSRPRTRPSWTCIEVKCP